MAAQTAEQFWEESKHILLERSIEQVAKASYIAGQFEAERTARNICDTKGCETFKCADAIKQSVIGELRTEQPIEEPVCRCKGFYRHPNCPLHGRHTQRPHDERGWQPK